jgi:hypothetical protein
MEKVNPTWGFGEVMRIWKLIALNFTRHTTNLKNVDTTFNYSSLKVFLWKDSSGVANSTIGGGGGGGAIFMFRVLHH